MLIDCIWWVEYSLMLCSHVHGFIFSNQRLRFGDFKALNCEFFFSTKVLPSLRRYRFSCKLGVQWLVLCNFYYSYSVISKFLGDILDFSNFGGGHLIQRCWFSSPHNTAQVMTSSHFFFQWLIWITVAQTFDKDNSQN